MKNEGISYIEVVAALALVGVTVLAASSMTAAHPVGSARLAAHEDMLTSLDAVLERVRSGVAPAVSGRIQSPIVTRTRVSLSLEVRQSELPGLVWVRATARSTVRGRQLERSMETAIWSSS